VAATAVPILGPEQSPGPPTTTATW